MSVYFSVVATATLMSRDVLWSHMGKRPANSGIQRTRKELRTADAE